MHATLPPGFGRPSTRPSRAWTAGPTCSPGRSVRRVRRHRRTAGRGQVGPGPQRASPAPPGSTPPTPRALPLYLLRGRPGRPLQRLHRERRRPGGRGLSAAPGAALRGRAGGVRERGRGRLRRRRPRSAPVQGRADGQPAARRPHRRRRRTERWGQLGRSCRAGPSTPRSSASTAKTYLFSGDRYMRYSGADYSYVDAGFPRLLAGDWGGLRACRRRVRAGRRRPTCSAPPGCCSATGPGGDRLGATRPTSTPAAARRSCGNGCSRTASGVTVDAAVQGARSAVAGHRPSTGCASRCDANLAARSSVWRCTARRRGSSTSATPARYYPTRPGLPAAADRQLVEPARRRSPASRPRFARVDAVFTGRTSGPTCSPATGSSSSTTGTAGGRSRKSLRRATGTACRSTRVDAAFVGTDGKTYCSPAARYVRYSGDDYSRVDDRYPARRSPASGATSSTTSPAPGASTPRWSCASTRARRAAPSAPTPTCSPATSTSATRAARNTRPSTTATRGDLAAPAGRRAAASPT